MNKKIYFIIASTLCIVAHGVSAMHPHTSSAVNSKKRLHSDASNLNTYPATNAGQENYPSFTLNTGYLNFQDEAGHQAELDELITYMQTPSSTTTPATPGPQAIYNELIEYVEKPQENTTHTPNVLQQSPLTPSMYSTAYNALMHDNTTSQPQTPSYYAIQRDLENSERTSTKTTRVPSARQFIPPTHVASHAPQLARPTYHEPVYNTNNTIRASFPQQPLINSARYGMYAKTHSAITTTTPVYHEPIASVEQPQINTPHQNYPPTPSMYHAYNALMSNNSTSQPQTPSYYAIHEDLLQNTISTPHNQIALHMPTQQYNPTLHVSQNVQQQPAGYLHNAHSTTTTTSSSTQNRAKRARTVQVQPTKFLPDPHMSMLPIGPITRRDSATSEPRASGELTEEKLLDLATENLFPYLKKGVSLPTTFVVLLKREKDIGDVRLRNLACIAKQYLPATQTHALYETLQQSRSEIAPARQKYVSQILSILRPEGIDNSLSGNEIITRQWPCDTVRTLLKQEFMTKDVIKTLIKHSNYCPDMWHILHETRNPRSVQDFAVTARITFSAQQKAEMYNYLVAHPLEGEGAAESIGHILSTFFEGVTPAGCTPMHTVFSTAVLPVKACLVDIPNVPQNESLRLKLGEKIFCHGSRNEIKQAMDMKIPCTNSLAIIEQRFADKSAKSLKDYATRVGYRL